MTKIAGLFALMLLLAGCGSKPETTSATPPAAAQATAIKRYSMHGKVVSVNTADKTAKVDAAEVPGWMSAMVMDYPVREAAELAKMAPDKNIEATVFVEGDNFWLGEVKETK